MTRYYCVYERRTGEQRGHVSIDDLAAEKAANPHLRYEPSRVAERAQRAEVDAWESREIERAETKREARVDRERAQAAADRRDAQQAASRGCLNCCWCGGENPFAAERCDWCKEDPMLPAEGLEEPPFARLHELSVEAILDAWDRTSEDDCRECGGEAA